MFERRQTDDCADLEGKAGETGHRRESWDTGGGSRGERWEEREMAGREVEEMNNIAGQFRRERDARGSGP